MGNANQNHKEIPPDSQQDGYYPENRKQGLVRMWKNWNLGALRMAT